MPQGPSYIFALTDRNFNFWQEDANSDVTLNANPYYLDFSPSGWDGIAVQVIRERMLWATNRSVTVPLTYIKDGGHIIKHVAYSKGYEEPLYLMIGVRKTIYNPVPKGTVSILNLAQGANAGTITGPANTTVYVKIVVSGGQGTVGGNVGSEYLNLYAGNQYIVKVKLNATGISNYNLTLTTLSGPNVTATTQISNLNGTTEGGYGYYYKKIYRGEINLVDFVHNDAKVTCTTVEDGLPKHFKANQKTIYELSFDVDEAILLKFDGIELFNKTNYGLPGVQELGGAFVGGVNMATMPIFLTTQEGDGYGLTYLSVQPEQIGTNGDALPAYLANSNNWAVMNTGQIPVDIVWQGRKRFLVVESQQGGLDGDPLLELFFVKSNGAVTYIENGINPAQGSTLDYPYTINFTLQPGEKIWPVRNFRKTGDIDAQGPIVIKWDEEFSFDRIDVTTRRPTTYVKHLPLPYVFKKLIELTTGSEYSSAASAFLNAHANKALTSGNAIREFADAVLPVSLDMVFKFCDSIDSVGIKELPGNLVTIDKKERLVNYGNVIHLGRPTYGTPKVSFAKEYMYNEVEIGYTEIKADIGALNGKQDFFCKHLYSLGTVKQPGKIDKVSTIKATPWEQEKIRTTIIEKVTSDYKSDNDVFVNVHDSILVPVEGTTPAHYSLDRSLNATLTGVDAVNSVWNASISVARMVRENLPFFNSCTYEMDQFILDFKNADRNADVVCDGIPERNSYVIGNIASRFFKPVWVDAEWPVPDNILELLDADPVQVFDFLIGNTLFIGILNKISIEHATRKTQSLQFLSAPANDFTKLIKYIG